MAKKNIPATKTAAKSVKAASKVSAKPAAKPAPKAAAKPANNKATIALKQKIAAKQAAGLPVTGLTNKLAKKQDKIGVRRAEAAQAPKVQQANFGEALSGLMTGIVANKTGRPMPKDLKASGLRVGPDVRKDIPGYKPGQVQATVNANKGAGNKRVGNKPAGVGAGRPMPSVQPGRTPNTVVPIGPRPSVAPVGARPAPVGAVPPRPSVPVVPPRPTVIPPRIDPGPQQGARAPIAGTPPRQGSGGGGNIAQGGARGIQRIAENAASGAAGMSDPKRGRNQYRFT